MYQEDDENGNKTHILEKGGADKWKKWEFEYICFLKVSCFLDFLEIVVFPGVAFNRSYACNHIINQLQSVVIALGYAALDWFLHTANYHLPNNSDYPEDTKNSAVLPAVLYANQNVHSNVQNHRNYRKYTYTQSSFKHEEVRWNQCDHLSTIDLHHRFKSHLGHTIVHGSDDHLSHLNAVSVPNEKLIVPEKWCNQSKYNKYHSEINTVCFWSCSILDLLLKPS